MNHARARRAAPTGTGDVKAIAEAHGSSVAC
jgi:hypothetical protein